MKTSIGNWGMYPVIESNFIDGKYPTEIFSEIKNFDNLIARGNGRCYGDSSLNENIFSTLKLNKILGIDENSGIINCQSGVLLSEILAVIVPMGFFLPVTPGTKLITVGGALAADVHGKNHHKEGCFSSHVISFELLVSTGEIITCSETENSDLFYLTFGAMGLTGIILSASFRLKKIETSFITQKSIKAKNLTEIMQHFSENEHYTYSVAWIDCLAKGNSLGKSILMLGEHTKANELNSKFSKNPFLMNDKPKLNIPFNFPGFALNSLSIKAFNFLYYNKQRSQILDSQLHYEPYFYPLDIINNWNRMYGKNGFTQHQFVLPMNTSADGLKEILSVIAASGEGSFLAVLKLFGESSQKSKMSFPFRGYTLALDFKISDKVFKLLNQLDIIVEQCGGRLYLAKDVRMSPEFYNKTYPALNRNSDYFQSLQSRRLKI